MVNLRPAPNTLTPANVTLRSNAITTEGGGTGRRGRKRDV